jgi:hypothetical protein
MAPAGGGRAIFTGEESSGSLERKKASGGFFGFSREV